MRVVKKCFCGLDHSELDAHHSTSEAGLVMLLIDATIVPVALFMASIVFLTSGCSGLGGQ